MSSQSLATCVPHWQVSSREQGLGLVHLCPSTAPGPQSSTANLQSMFDEWMNEWVNPLAPSKVRQGAPLVAQMGKNLPAVQETWVQSLLGRSPGEGNGHHSSDHAWRIPQTEEPGGSQRVGHDWAANTQGEADSTPIAEVRPGRGTLAVSKNAIALV